MKKLLILIGLSVALMLKTTSCSKDFLDTAPSDGTTIANLTNSFEDARSLLVGLNRSRFMMDSYNTGTQPFLAGEYPIIKFLEYLGDDKFNQGATSQQGNWALLSSLHSEMATSAMTALPWNRYYYWILSMNILLSIVDEVNATEAERNWLRAQALAYRAYYFHKLVRMYGPAYNHSPDGLGIVLTLTPPEPPFTGIPRSTVRESYEQIEGDLLEAVRLMGLPGVATIAAAHDITFIRLNVIHGLLSRVYLDMHNWAEAARFAYLANTVPLMTRAQFADGFLTRNAEWMWASFVPSDESQSWATAPVCLTNAPGFRTASWGFSNAINRNLIAHTDSANDARIGGVPGTRPMMSHFMGHELAYNKFQWAGLSNAYDLVYMRGAEMRLNEAEALLMGNLDINRARMLTQEVINARIDDGGAFAATLDAMDRYELLNEVIMQRRLEFWGEGHRFFDLKRRIGSIPVGSSTPVADILDRRTSGHPRSFNWQGGTGTVGWFITNPQSRHWVWLVPQREINVNSTVIQSPTGLPW
ncbi:MAG: RagB/SusD family nutrient uptake outer membrane protein [Bacteroidales bacterium]|nr:RagB/SusD family nutrient uptake outer membrane protein [Bacteroidales bacterium]